MILVFKLFLLASIYLEFIAPAPTPVNPIKYLKKYGYYSGQNDYQFSKWMNAISRFQSFAGLPVTGNLDPNTHRLMKRPRCGLPDMEIRKNAFSMINPRKWSSNIITYHIENTAQKLSINRTTIIIRKAFKLWSDVIPITFRELKTPTADIMIKFARGDHGDGFNFDGAGKTLAHAFPPEDGDTHFDNDEPFTENSNDGVNLLWVAVHEFGHALGLQHSKVQDSVMFPFYNGFRKQLQLHTDDVTRIVNLYGKKGTPSKTTPPPTVKPVCKDRYDTRTCEAWRDTKFCNHVRVSLECQKTCKLCS